MQYVVFFLTEHYTELFKNRSKNRSISYAPCTLFFSNRAVYVQCTYTAVNSDELTKVLTQLIIYTLTFIPIKLLQYLHKLYLSILKRVLQFHTQIQQHQKKSPEILNLKSILVTPFLNKALKVKSKKYNKLTKSKMVEQNNDNMKI